MADDDVEFIGVSELAEAVGEALSEIAETDRRMKSGATEIPSERTIRFYLEKQLLPKPAKRFGQTLVFGRIHLLHLLVIKKLQADGVPLSAIPDILKKKGRTEDQLEELLKEDVDIFGSVAALPPAAMSMSYESPPREDGDAPEPRRQSYQAERKKAKSFLEGLIGAVPPRKRQSSVPLKMVAAPQPDPDIAFSLAEIQAPPEPAKWTRHELLPGLEINISDDYKAPTDDTTKANLLATLRKILGI